MSFWVISILKYIHIIIYSYLVSIRFDSIRFGVISLNKKNWIQFNMQTWKNVWLIINLTIQKLICSSTFFFVSIKQIKIKVCLINTCDYYFIFMFFFFYLNEIRQFSNLIFHSSPIESKFIKFNLIHSKIIKKTLKLKSY